MGWLDAPQQDLPGRHRLARATNTRTVRALDDAGEPTSLAQPNHCTDHLTARTDPDPGSPHLDMADRTAFAPPRRVTATRAPCQAEPLRTKPRQARTRLCATCRNVPDRCPVGLSRRTERLTMPLLTQPSLVMPSQSARRHGLPFPTAPDPALPCHSLPRATDAYPAASRLVLPVLCTPRRRPTHAASESESFANFSMRNLPNVGRKSPTPTRRPAFVRTSLSESASMYSGKSTWS